MKHYTSKTLKLIAFLYMGFPIAYVTFSALIFNVPASNYVRMILSPLFILVTAVAAAAGFGLWEMRRWSWHAFVSANVLIAYLSAVVAQRYSASEHKFLAFLTSVLILIGMMYRVAREVRVPYFFPKIRWWESNPRYRLSVQAKLVKKDGTSLDGQILDLSMGGCFIKLRTELTQDENLQIQFRVFGKLLELEGTTVWRSKSTVTHPKGVGVKFTVLDRSRRRTLRLVTRRLKQIATFYRTSRYLMNQEDFIKRLEEMESKELDRLGAG